MSFVPCGASGQMRVDGEGKDANEEHGTHFTLSISVRGLTFMMADFCSFYIVII